MTLSRIAVVVGVLVALAATAVIAIVLALRTMPGTMPAETPAVPEATTAAPEATMPAAAPTAPAAAGEPLNLAVVDVGKVFRESAAVKSINGQLRPYLEGFRTDAAKVERELRDSQEELARRQATSLTNEAYTAERRDLEQRALEAQDTMLGRKRALDQAQAAAMRQVETTLNNIVAKIFTERKLTLILRRDQTAFFNPALDITEDVIGRLDKELPTVEIAAPAKPITDTNGH